MYSSELEAALKPIEGLDNAFEQILAAMFIITAHMMTKCVEIAFDAIDAK